jgi:hypothetical protein
MYWAGSSLENAGRTGALAKLNLSEAPAKGEHEKQID